MHGGIFAMTTDVLEMLKSQLDPEEFRKLTETRQGLERRFMRLESETNYLRILPGRKGKLWFREVHNHFKVGGPDKKGVCICLQAEKLAQSPCFLEDVITYFQKSLNLDDQNYAKSLRPSRIYWVNAYNAKSDDPVVRIVPLSYTTFQQLFQLYMAGEHSFLDVEDGVNTVISKQAGNKYFVRLDTKREPIASPELLDQCYDLDEVVQEQIRTYEEQMGMYPPELIARMRAAGSVRLPSAPVGSTEVAFTSPILEAKETTAAQEKIRSQMDHLMRQAGKEKIGLEDI
jgi:hypothetical protein